MMVVLTFHVGALTYFNTLECSHASLQPGKAGSCKQPLNTLKAVSDQRENVSIVKRFDKINDSLIQLSILVGLPL